jgi:NAD(P)-dependent dehydrogenase (short-subunit alcohol dehydrogenase family)
MSTITQNDLEGQRALVTGATSGIGRAVALQLARDGAEVVVHGRNAERGAETVKEITAAGGKASFVAADLSAAADVQRLASDVGDVDILINNAGISAFAPTADSLPEWPPAATAASSASAAWPAASDSSAARHTARRRRRSRR